jgi:hypothetical protein
VWMGEGLRLSKNFPSPEHVTTDLKLSLTKRTRSSWRRNEKQDFTGSQRAGVVTVLLLKLMGERKFLSKIGIQLDHRKK